MRTLFIMMIFALPTALFGQCKLETFPKGKKINFVSKTWPEKPSIAGAILSGAKAKKVAKVAAERKENMEAGKVAPTTSTFFMTVEDCISNDDGQVMVVSFENEKKEKNYSLSVCDGTNMFIHRNVEKAPAPEAQSFYVNGVQKIPVNIKVGDVLEPYEDAWVYYPKTTTVTAKKQVFDRFKAYSKFNGYSQGEMNGQRVVLANYEQGYKAKYKDVEVELEKTTYASAHIINYAKSKVTGTEEVEVAGKKYTAYLIESEQWVNNSTNIQYSSLDKSLADKMTKKDNKFAQKIAEDALNNMRAYGMEVTDGGYIVNRIKEWYVPSLGIVKTQTYDPYNVKTSEVSLTSFY